MKDIKNDAEFVFTLCVGDIKYESRIGGFFYYNDYSNEDIIEFDEEFSKFEAMVCNTDKTDMIYKAVSLCNKIDDDQKDRLMDILNDFLYEEGLTDE